MIPSIQAQIAQSMSAIIGARPGSFSPQSLFAKGQQGAWYDPSDLSTLFQDAAGTIPVTGTGQPVGLMRDKSGRGNHASQATAASRPIFRDVGGLRYLECDGVDDGMVTGSIDFTGTDKMLVCAGVRKMSDAGAGSIVGLGTTAAQGQFEILASSNRTSVARTSMSVSIGAGESAVLDCSAVQYAAPVSLTLAASLDYAKLVAADEITVTINSIPAVATAGGGQGGVGPFLNAPLYLFRRGGASLAFNGLFYGAIIAGSTYSAAQIASAERYLAGKSGVTL